MTIAIRFENVSKQYQLGEVGTGTLAHDLHRWIAKLRGRPDPFAKVSQINDREAVSEATGPAYVWALRDVNFDVRQGDVLGIIGRNGAGKSTLLKLLSRVTAPTLGEIKARGRIASLLEVGTGFHPELTGRENIYLNGAVLGMRRREIDRRLEEIVDFSGCARYIDTPVKRYSSGMTVRLGFAVAAHLECEILVVDEVLAVGDDEFQDRCIGKMREIAGASQRTVIFVSHNMNSIRSLCKQAVGIERGTVAIRGSADEVVRWYLSKNTAGSCGTWVANEVKSAATAYLVSANLSDAQGTLGSRFAANEGLELTVVFTASVDVRAFVAFRVNDSTGLTVFSSAFGDVNLRHLDFFCRGRHTVRCSIPANFLPPGRYSILLAVGCPLEGNDDVREGVLGFEITEEGYVGSHDGRWGVVAPILPWRESPTSDCLLGNSN